ncbi:helix-turn-helix domain-containing protein [Lacibacterium aquatile]|uniref:Helix-turn-helix domain-containing protein n=1 Tax=Lacibacterium aquatile TaxID=1168082 RepID=A0ABW5DQU7_9PROT
MDVKLSAGSTLFIEGDKADHLYNISHGCIRIHKLLPDGRRQVIGFLTTGDFLGFAVRDGYAYSAEAVTNTKLCGFSRVKLEHLLQAFPAMEKRLLGIAANELAVAQDQMLLLGRKTAAERLASFLIAFSDRLLKADLPISPIVLPMARSDISDYLGLTNETISRTFTRFRKLGLIELNNAETIYIRDMKRLRRVAGGEEP